MTAENLRIGSVVIIDHEDGFKVHVVGTNPIITENNVTFKPILKKNRTGEFFVSTQNVTLDYYDGGPSLDVFDILHTLDELDNANYSDDLSEEENNSLSDLLSKANGKMRWAHSELVDNSVEDSSETVNESNDESSNDSSDEVSEPQTESEIAPLLTHRFYVTVETYDPSVEVVHLIRSSLNSAYNSSSVTILE